MQREQEEPPDWDARRAMVLAAVELAQGNAVTISRDLTDKKPHGQGKRAIRADVMGAEAIGIRSVAMSVGRSQFSAGHLSPSAPLYYFPDRTCLLAAVAAEGFRRLAETLRTAMDRHIIVESKNAPHPVRMAAAELVKVTAFWSHQHRGLWDVMYEQALAEDFAALMSVVGENADFAKGMSIEAVASLVDVSGVLEARHPGKELRAKRQRQRRAECFAELCVAKRMCIDPYLAIVNRLPGNRPLGARYEIVNTITAVADGLSLQLVTEWQIGEEAMRHHVKRATERLLGFLDG